MPSVRESRVYVEKPGTVTAYVAADLGVAAVRVSDDTVGEFSLVERCTARDVAVTGHGTAVAASSDVLLDAGGGFEETGLGPAVAVTALDGDVLAATEDGRVARYDGDWESIGRLDSDVRALDADLIAAADGVHRVTDTGLASAGLTDARDVSAAGVPYAATASGLYALGNGWMDVLDGDFTTMTADPASATPGELGRAHAAADALYEHANGDWQPRSIPVDERVVDAAYPADATIVLTAAGAVAVDAGDGFRHRSLGLRDARAIAVTAEGNA